MKKNIANVPNEGDPVAEPAESQSVTKEETTPAAEVKQNEKEETVPFHKNPRWKKMQAELKEAREKINAFEGQKSKTPDMPDWWRRQYGETDESKQAYERVVSQGGELEWMKSIIKAELQAEAQAQEAQKAHEDEMLEEQIDEMKSEGLEFDRKELLKFMIDLAEKTGSDIFRNDDGSYDLRRALALKNELFPKQPKDNSTRIALAKNAGISAPTQRAAGDVPIVDLHEIRRGRGR